MNFALGGSQLNQGHAVIIGDEGKYESQQQKQQS
jgi:hypothetical protein